MPISKQAKANLADFGKYSGTEHEDTYDDDFNASTDSEESRASPVNAGTQSHKSDGSKSTRRVSSPVFRKSNKKPNGTSAAYSNDRSVYSEPFTSPRTGMSGINYRRSEQTRTGGSYQKKKDRRKGQREYAPKPPPTNNNAVFKRVLSASRNKMNALQNVVLELQLEIDELRLENRDLRRSTKKQEKAIRKLDDDEADLPLMIIKHNSEVKFLKEKVKKLREDSSRAQEESRKKDLDILKLRDKVKKCEQIMKDKRLDERDQLQQKLDRLEADMALKEGKVEELERIVKLGEKVRARELKEKNEKYKKAVEELKRLEHLQRDLQERFKEKEKELEVQNIYSQRINLKRKVLRTKDISIDSIIDSPSSSRAAKSSSPKVSLLGDVKEDADANTAKDRLTADCTTELNSVDGSADMETMVSALRRKEEELERILEEERKRKQFEEDKLRLKEMENRIKQKQDEIEDAGRRKTDAGKQDDMLRREEAQRRRQEEERQERHAMEEISRKKEEERRVIEQLELQRKEEEDRKMEAQAFSLNGTTEADLMRRLAEQQDRKKELESYSVDEDAQRKKDVLLARIKAIDDGKNVSEVKGQRAFGSIGHSSIQRSEVTEDGNKNVTPKKKPIFLESTAPENDKEVVLRHAPLDFSAKRRSSKDYTFKDTDSNLHQGLPSHPDLVNQNKSKPSEDIAFGGYKPTVNSGGKTRTSRFQNKDKNIEKNDDDFLFFNTKARVNSGGSAKRREEKEKDDFLFFNTKEAKEPRYPVDDEKKKPDMPRNRTRSISDDDSHLFTIGGKGQEKSGSNLSKKSTGSGKKVFGTYEPTFGNSGSANSNGMVSPDSDPFSDDGPKHGRRRGYQAGGNIFTENKDNNKKTAASPVKKTDGIGIAAARPVDSFIDDDIEEMVLT